jgi:hypothetical protein
MQLLIVCWGISDIFLLVVVLEAFCSRRIHPFILFFPEQWDLFTTLKALGFLGAFLMFVGHRILSHLASISSKLKSA